MRWEGSSDDGPGGIRAANTNAMGQRSKQSKDLPSDGLSGLTLRPLSAAASPWPEHLFVKSPSPKTPTQQTERDDPHPEKTARASSHRHCHQRAAYLCDGYRHLLPEPRHQIFVDRQPAPFLAEIGLNLRGRAHVRAWRSRRIWSPDDCKRAASGRLIPAQRAA